MTKQPNFLHVETNENLKLIKRFWLDMVKIGCGYLGYRTKKLAVSQKGVDGIN